MWRLLTGEKLVHEQAMKRLDARFATQAPKRIPTVFLGKQFQLKASVADPERFDLDSDPTLYFGSEI